MPTYGPNSPSTWVSEAYSGSGAAWDFSGGTPASADDNLSTAGTGSASVPTEYLKVTGFGFSIGAGETIDGILVEYRCRGFGGASVKDSRVRIVKGGTVGSTDKSSATAWPDPLAYVSRGGAADLWGETWADTDIEDSTFGVAIAGYDPSEASTLARVDHVRVTVYTSAATVGGMVIQRRQSSRTLRRM